MSGQIAERLIPVSDGIEIFVRSHAGSDAGAPPVVCLHGLTRNARDFEAVAPYIAGLGPSVHALDIRGRGRSSRDPDWSRYRPDVYARDVIEVLDVLGIARADVIGTSMGGLIAMLIASIDPGRVHAVVLNDVGPVLNPAGLARIVGYVGNVGPFPSWQALEEAVRASQATVFPHADDAFWSRFARRVGREVSDGTIVFDYDPNIAKAFAQPAGAVPPDPFLLFDALKERPILVLRGALSDILVPDGVAAMAARHPGLEVVEIPDVGHAPTLDEPEARAALQRFICPRTVPAG